jgi:hypothetical protein
MRPASRFDDVCARSRVTARLPEAPESREASGGHVTTAYAAPTARERMRPSGMKCAICEDCGWVCENHPERPWHGAHACACGGAGMPCQNAISVTNHGCRVAFQKTTKMPRVTESGWSRKLDEPIIVPSQGPRVKSRTLVTLKDAGTYITKLPKAKHSAPEWQAAMEALLLAARGGPMMLAHIQRMKRFISPPATTLTADRSPIFSSVAPNLLKPVRRRDANTTPPSSPRRHLPSQGVIVGSGSVRPIQCHSPTAASRRHHRPPPSTSAQTPMP